MIGMCADLADPFQASLFVVLFPVGPDNRLPLFKLFLSKKISYIYFLKLFLKKVILLLVDLNLPQDEFIFYELSPIFIVIIAVVVVGLLK